MIFAFKLARKNSSFINWQNDQKNQTVEKLKFHLRLVTSFESRGVNPVISGTVNFKIWVCTILRASKIILSLEK